VADTAAVAELDGVAVGELDAVAAGELASVDIVGLTLDGLAATGELALAEVEVVDEPQADTPRVAATARVAPADQRARRRKLDETDMGTFQEGGEAMSATLVDALGGG